MPGWSRPSEQNSGADLHPKDFVVYYDASGLGLGCVLMTLAAQKEASDESAGLKKGLDEMTELRNDGGLYYLDRIWVPLKDDVRTLIMDEAYKSKYSIHPGADKMYYDLRDRYWWPGMKKDIAVYLSKCLTCLNVKAEHQRPSGLLQQPKIPEWKWERIAMDFVTKLPRTNSVVHFGKNGKLAPRFVGPFEIIAKLQKPPVNEIQVDAKLNFVEEPMEILERDFKKLKRSRIAIVKVWWNSKRRFEFTWEREDQMKLKYPHMFSADK
ncbi:putative reverse transcriptase domain-containing protein [Tanacetum coccineum]|uniref:Reverse transcriptase domain-containing protein n=1 Tax=Tanacetum coccineum TaxID=301880 RepID=A0ABQ5AKA5_9ASTR